MKRKIAVGKLVDIQAKELGSRDNVFLCKTSVCPLLNTDYCGCINGYFR
jgi:hypothetical protein